MKVGTITKISQKGQIVIPKKIRDALKIDTSIGLNLILRGNGIYIYPVEEVITSAERESSYVKLLQKTQGSWGKKDRSPLRKERRKVELIASRKRKQLW